TAAHILHDDQVAARGGLAGKLGFIVLVVGRAREQHREGPLSGGVVDIRAEGYAIAGLHCNATFDDDFWSGLAQGSDRGQHRNGESKQTKSLFQHRAVNSSAAKATSILRVQSGADKQDAWKIALQASTSNRAFRL